MPSTKHRIKGTHSFQVGFGMPTRYRFRHGTLMHGGSKVRERLGFRGNSKLVEIAFVPIRLRKKK